MQPTTIKNLVKIYYDSQDFRKSAANRLRPYMDKDESIDEILELLDPNVNIDNKINTRIELFKNSIDVLDKDTIWPEVACLIKDIDDYKDSAEIQQIFQDPFPQMCAEMINSYRKIEKSISLLISNQIKDYPINEWLLSQKGIGPMLAGGLIGYIGDISKFDKVTSLWAYAGMGVIEICETCNKRHVQYGSKGAWIQHTAERLKEQNDKVKDKSKQKKNADFIKEAESKLCHCERPVIKRVGQRRIQGQLLDYNPEFKQLCFLIGDQFIKQRESPYRKLYDQFRLEYENRPDLMKERDARKGGQSKGTGHINDMARRKTVKIFLSHLWEEWRTLEGLPTPAPYSFAVLGHTDKIEPF